MQNTSAPTIARILIVCEQEIAVIERNKNGHRFLAFPGGHIEEGESPQRAAVREAYEELDISLPQSIELAYIYASSDWGLQYYFYISLDKKQSLMLREDTPEYEDTNRGDNTYSPKWTRIDELLSQDALPRSVAEMFTAESDAMESRLSHPALISEMNGVSK